MEQIVEYLQDLSVSSRQHLEIPGSPQFQAALWLAQEDGLTMEIPTATSNTNTNTLTTNSDNSDDATTTSTHTRFVECYDLAVFYEFRLATFANGKSPSLLRQALPSPWESPIVSRVMWKFLAWGK
jgi:hypothetical protein